MSFDAFDIEEFITRALNNVFQNISTPSSTYFQVDIVKNIVLSFSYFSF